MPSSLSKEQLKYWESKFISQLTLELSNDPFLISFPPKYRVQYQITNKEMILGLQQAIQSYKLESFKIGRRLKRIEFMQRKLYQRLMETPQADDLISRQMHYQQEQIRLSARQSQIKKSITAQDENLRAVSLEGKEFRDPITSRVVKPQWCHPIQHSLFAFLVLASQSPYFNAHREKFENINAFFKSENMNWKLFFEVRDLLKKKFIPPKRLTLANRVIMEQLGALNPVHFATNCPIRRIKKQAFEPFRQLILLQNSCKSQYLFSNKDLIIQKNLIPILSEIEKLQSNYYPFPFFRANLQTLNLLPLALRKIALYQDISRFYALQLESLLKDNRRDPQSKTPKHLVMKLGVLYESPFEKALACDQPISGSLAILPSLTVARATSLKRAKPKIKQVVPAIKSAFR